MAISDYLRDLRALVGGRLLLLPGVAGIVRDAEDRVLFIRRADNGEWGLPAGAIDPGETPAEAVAREVREETGLEVTVGALLAGDDAAEVRWCTEEDAALLPLTDGLLDAVRRMEAPPPAPPGG